EYDNPLDRRFHAQPNACPKCGPKVELVDAQGKPVASPDPIATASQLLKRGSIIAIKGLGGFQLACDATNKAVVKTLRQRKRRWFKPFAIMVTNMAEVKKHCYVSPEEEKLLSSPQSPIVLMRWKEGSPVSREIAPNLAYLGIMLPYTPLHHILLRDTQLPLVMTSGNLSEEPIAKDNDEALRRLKGIADYFLIHNRDIYSRYDDSVAMVERGTNQLVRRARSYAPCPIILPFKAKQVLGCGAEIKNTFCLTRDNYAFLSQHIGDMENMGTLEHFGNTISLYKRLFRIEPEIVAYDLHPDYLATKYAQELSKSGPKLISVQHHHAHIASCMADNGLQSAIIGVAFDGTGMGSDGHIWGGEFLVADYKSFSRLGHLEYLPLPGGDAAIKRPYRTAIGYILSLLRENALRRLAFMELVSEVEAEVIKRQIERGLNSPLTSSMGRLFDAISALIGIRGKIDYEGQAAVELEMAACKENADDNESYPYNITKDRGMRIIKLRELLQAIVEDLKQGSSKARISIRFHNTIAQMTNEMCQLIANETGINQVALSGGVFQNRLLLNKTASLLGKSDFQVFTHKQVPSNDGGISLGQAVIANFAK
ncbi:MAG: carbamoyltransferase HypF, partial [Dehalococcoidia bacterium]|nr:carbamoyltransferase HypF [Dehalococcoidia bacterium]